MAGTPGFDLFLSCAGPDRVAVRKLRAALEQAGLRVFLDESSIGLFDSITAEIEGALLSSTALLAYYSRHFSTRRACQQELTAAFLAGQREGDAARRIIVVNPEDPETDHLLPAELADRRYALLLTSADDVRELARHIRDRVRSLTGTLGSARLVTDRTRYGRVPSTAGFVGRYREQWQLHTDLHDVDLPMTRPAPAPPIADVVGMPGMGKTALVASYAWNFGAAYADGAVCWLDLAGVGRTDDAVLARYEDEVRSLAQEMGVPTAGVPGREVLGLVADRLDHSGGRSLWVVDNVPAGLRPETVRRLIPPGSTRIRTVLTGHEAESRGARRPLVLRPLPDSDVAALLEQSRPPADDERDGLARLVPQLRGHPMVVQLAANALRRRGFVSYDDVAALLIGSPDALADVTGLLAPTLRSLPDAARLVLQLAGVLAPVGLPARLLERVVDRLLGPGSAGQAMVRLEDVALATVEGATWRVHQLVVDAASGVESSVPRPALLRTAAAALDELAGAPALSPLELGDLMRHLVALTDADGLNAADGGRLLRRATGYYDDRGEPVLSVPLHGRLVRLDATPDTYARAADAHLAAGEYELARSLAQLATGHRGRRVLAEALDALGRYAEAEPLWDELMADPAVDLRTELGRLRSLRLRGRLTAVQQAAPAVIARAAGSDLGQAAELELARAEVLTSGQKEARTRAQQVIEHYEQCGLPGHANALDAQEVLAEARLTMHLWELNPDPNHWRDAEADLKKLVERFRESHGVTNPLTLAATVDYAYALISQGKRTCGGTELDTLLPAIEQRLGTDHRLHHRALFLRGLIHAQLQDATGAEPLLRRALDGQRATLGIAHAHTLRTQYELAVILKLAGKPGWKPLMEEVHAHARDAVGRENDLYTQSLLALGLLRLPGPLVRAISYFGRPRADGEECGTS